MKARTQELWAEARANKDKAAGESAVLAKIAEMLEPERAMATRLHAIIKASAPALSPKTWYGMPVYATEGKVVCFFTILPMLQVASRNLSSINDIDIKIKIFRLALRQAQGAPENLYLKNYSYDKERQRWTQRWTATQQSNTAT